MTIDYVILDFDGVFTDVFAEAEPYKQEYARLFSQRTGIAADRLARLVGNIREEIKGDSLIGWEVDLQIVAPPADPYVETTVIHRLIIKRLKSGEIHIPSLSLPDDEETFMDGMFNDAYKKKGSCTFCPGAKRFIDTLTEEMQGASIVSNPKTDSVQEKLDLLGIAHPHRVNLFGYVKKYINDASDERIQRSIHLPGLGRDILIRRRHYYDVLHKLSKQGYTPDRTAVIGDIFELDLALPTHLGYSIIQLDTSATQPHERLYHQKHLRSALVQGLDGVLDTLGIRK